MICPSCGSDLKITITTYKVPFFDEVILTSVVCECGFKHSDSFIAKIREPTRFKIKIRSDNLSIKIVRSTSGTIKIPEIGVEIEPGPASQAFITNLEGILRRVYEIVETVMKWNKDDEDKVKRCEWILEKITKTMNGKDELTLILEDPFGNSLIVSSDVLMETMSKEEAEKLKAGITVFELTGLSEDDLMKLQDRF
ncbi:MAG: ZPR1 zinc finger domain-containing protein [Archaeoglobaceae archaeon]|nr:ZPR1 zinc finger domain-containing protein [Archaeoglobaceae archaeon]MCX8152776.1 ZPR1 zinc finger domain-containing protein [Archaeoglobaceae archaeon]MDW8013483.1 ZPR1 zinc finger domain-containing protein [Archaeoglobaceae archaeon]